MELVKSIYNLISKNYKANINSYVYDHKYLEKFLLLFKEGDKILDIGAGTGLIANEVKTLHKLDLTAIDFSRGMIKLSRKSYSGLNYRLMDLRKLKFSKNSFDGVISNYSIIHLQESEIKPSLIKINNVLKKKGYLYLALQEPRNSNQKDGYYPIPYKKKVKLFMKLFGQKEITSYLNESGFKILNVERRKPKNKEFPFNKMFIIAQKR